MKSLMTALLVLLLTAALNIAPARAEEPRDTLVAAVNQVLSVLKGSEDFSKKKVEIQVIIDGLFDFTAIAQRSVGTHWKKFTPEEQKEFSEVFSQLLSNIYLDKLKDYSGEKVEFLEQLSAGKSGAYSKYLVKTKIMRSGATISVDYRMYVNQGRIKVYDIVIEGGVSLVHNYSVQFKSRLNKITPAELIKEVRAKVQDSQ